jgi:hypothetical protein
MYLLRAHLTRLGLFDDIEVSFCSDGEPRLMTVIHGGGAVGKTTLLTAIANTRPGHAVVNNGLYREDEEPGQVVCDYHLGQDDPDRPHPLVIASPNAKVFDESEREMQRRKEQSLFERVARETGFVFIAFPAVRWFSRSPISLLSPERNLARYDVRAPIGFDDATRGDIARETKQCLAYAAITAALNVRERSGYHFDRFLAAMQHAVDTLGQLVGLRWVGLDPLSLEPLFESEGGAVATFDHLPTRARHLVAFAALTVRTLWASCPARDPREAEGVVVIDEVDLYLDPPIQVKLADALRVALPRVQWVLSTSLPFVASGCDSNSVIALRRRTDHAAVELFTGPMAQLH